MKNGYNIEWTFEAERNLSAIFDYLEENWTQREISLLCSITGEIFPD